MPLRRGRFGLPPFTRRLLLVLAFALAIAGWRYGQSPIGAGDAGPGTAAGQNVAAAADEPAAASDTAGSLRIVAAAEAAPPPGDVEHPTASEARRAPRGHRATPEQRVSDLAAYLAAENLLALRDVWRLRAAQGDADAARRLRDLYDECLGVLFAGQALARAEPRNVLGVAGWQPPDAPARLAALQIGRARCRGILPLVEYQQAVRDLGRLQQEASRLTEELGHPASYTSAHDRADVLAWSYQRTSALLADGSPEALLSIGTTIIGMAARHRELSWVLAACELGYPCSAPSPFVRNWCVEWGHLCDGVGLVDYFRELSTPRDWRRALVERDEILRLLRMGDYAALLRPPGENRGGGG